MTKVNPMKTSYKFILLLFLIFSLQIIQKNDVKTIDNWDSEDGSTYIIWFVEDVVKSNEFPIGFTTTKQITNFSITTSWGFSCNKTLEEKLDPYLVWVRINSDLITSTGLVDIIIENGTSYQYDVTWDFSQIIEKEPINISLHYFYSCYWSGRTYLRADMCSNGDFILAYSVDTTNIAPVRPYPEDFSFKMNNQSLWTELISNLNGNTTSWSSWKFPPLNYSGPRMAMCDGGEWTQRVTIHWNDGTNTSYLEMVDDEDGTGERIYTQPDASNFNEKLMEIIDDLVTEYEEKPATFRIRFPSFFFILVPFLMFVVKRRKED